MMTKNEFEKKQILFAFLNAGEKVSFSNDNIIIKDPNGKVKHQSTCYRLFMVFIIGHISVTSGLLQRAHKFNFTIILMTPGLRIYEYLGTPMEGNVLLRRHQYGYNGLELGKQILENKVHNQRMLLTQERGKNVAIKEAIDKIKEYELAIGSYDGELSGLLGLEGCAARMYFANCFNNVEWHGRKPRIKNDYVNSTLDIGYTLIFNFIDAMLNMYGFDTYCGVLHKEFYMRKSLVCDFVEPFRVIIDKQVKKAINLEQCKAEDFTCVNGRYLLEWKHNPAYITFLMQPILKYKDDIFQYVQSFYRAFMKNKNVSEYPVFKTEA